MKEAMVCAPQPEAVEAGLDVLASGGNVIDAAIGAIVRPADARQSADVRHCRAARCKFILPGELTTASIFMGVHRWPWGGRNGKSRMRSVNDGFGFILKGEVNEIGYQSMTTPLTLKAFGEALERFGTKPLSELLEPAIEYCEQGFVVRPAVHRFWHQPAIAGRIERMRVITDDPASAKIYLKPDGSLHEVGEVLRNPDMGRTYRRIAERGISDFYKGEIAQAIAADMRAHGALGLEDLRTCSTEHSVPLEGTYRGFQLFTNQPPGGGLMILEMLNILEQFDLRAMGHNSADYIATVSEAMKIATVDKDARTGDPRFVDIPVAELTSKAYAALAVHSSGKLTHVLGNAGGPTIAGTRPHRRR